MTFEKYLTKIEDDYSLMDYPCMIKRDNIAIKIVSHTAGTGPGIVFFERIDYFDENVTKDWDTERTFVKRYGLYEYEEQTDGDKKKYAGKCPYCREENFVPDVVSTNAASYGGGISTFNCLYCNKVGKAYVSIKVVITDTQKTDEDSHWSSTGAMKG